MIRISKGANNKIFCIKITPKEEVPSDYVAPEIDSFVIIPGVTHYNNIYTIDNWIVFDSVNSYISVGFSCQGDLERFFTQLTREIKLNQIINVETKDFK